MRVGGLDLREGRFESAYPSATKEIESLNGQVIELGKDGQRSGDVREGGVSRDELR